MPYADDDNVHIYLTSFVDEHKFFCPQLSSCSKMTYRINYLNNTVSTRRDATPRYVRVEYKQVSFCRTLSLVESNSEHSLHFTLLLR